MNAKKITGKQIADACSLALYRIHKNHRKLLGECKVLECVRLREVLQVYDPRFFLVVQ